MVPLKPFAVPYVVVPRECRVQFPKPCFKGLKWGRWDCNVRGGAAESSVIRIACDLWVVRRVAGPTRPNRARGLFWCTLSRGGASEGRIGAVVVLVWVTSAGAGWV